MPTAYIKRNGTWSQIKKIYMKRNGSWVPMLTGYIKRNGSWSKIFGAGPSLNSAPVISSAAGGKLYDTYTSTTGSWDNAISYTYQWVRSDASNGITSAISGATSSTYKTKDADDGMWIGCEVTATDSGGTSNQATSSLTNIVKYEPSTDLGITLSGTPSPGNTITVNAGAISGAWVITTDNTNDTVPDTFTYAWKYSDGTTAYNNTGEDTYDITSQDNNKTIICYVTATNSGGYLTSPSESLYVQDIYSFSFGKTLYVNTNNMIHLDTGWDGAYPPYNDTWRTVAIYGKDFVQDQYSNSGTGNGLLKYWSNDSYFVIQNSTYLYSYDASTLNKIAYRVTYQAKFGRYAPNNSYVDIKFLNVGSSVGLPTFVGMYQGNNLLDQGISGPYYITTGTVMRIYFDGRAGTTSGISFTEIPSAAMMSADGFTSGDADDGYTSIYTSMNQYIKPTVTFTLSNFYSQSTSLSLDYASGSNDYSGLNWVARTGSHSGTVVSQGSVSGTNSINITGLNSETTYYIQVTPYNSMYQLGDTMYYSQATTAADAAAPSSISATAYATYFNISWATSTNATKYRIFWSGSSSTTANPAVSFDHEISAPTTSWIFGRSYPDDNGLTPSYGSSYYFYVSASSGNGIWSAYNLARTASSVALSGTAPANTVIPSISPSSGTAGTTQYTCNPGTWTGNPTPTYTYQWRYWDQGSIFPPLSGATSSTYTPPSNYVSIYGQSLYCDVTATNDLGSSTVRTVHATVSNPVLAPTNSTVPTLTYSSLNVGGTLTFGVGTWNNSPTSYDLRLYRGTQYVSSGETLSKSAGNVTSSTYTITQADYDSGQRYFRAYASASNSGGSSGLVAGQEVGPITNVVAPTINSSSISPSSGTAGSTTFTASASVSGTPAPTVTYQWQYFSTSFSFVNISGATSSSYTPPSNFNTLYPNYGFYCLITATNSGGTATSRPSATLNSPASGTAPTTPTSLSNSYSSGPTWSGSWAASSGTGTITYYWTLYQSTTSGGAITKTATGSTTGTSFTKSMASADGLWAYFTVYASNAYGTSGTATSGWA